MRRAGDLVVVVVCLGVLAREFFFAPAVRPELVLFVMVALFMVRLGPAVRSTKALLPHPSTDLRVVHMAPEERAVYEGARRLADLRGQDEVSPGESERFAAAAHRLARSSNW